MSNYLENKICQNHSMKTIAVDLNPYLEEEQKLLCAKCLTIRASTPYQVVLNNEFEAIIQEQKLKEYQQTSSKFESACQKYEQLYSTLKSHSDQVNGNINKILQMIQQQIENQKISLQQIKQPSEEIIQSDLMIFSSKIDSSISQTMNDSPKEKQQEFTSILQEQLLKLPTSDLNQEILQLVAQLSISESIQDESKSEKNYQCINSKKTPYINYECSKHGKEIIMFTFDQNYEGERILCVDCIPKCSQKLINLEEVNKLWMIHQGEVYDSHNSFFNQREQKQQQVLKIINKCQVNSLNLQNELIKFIHQYTESQKKDLLELELSKNKKSLFQLELNEIKNVLIILSSQDQLLQVQQSQNQMKSDDQNYYKQIVQKITQIADLQIDCLKQISYIFDSENSLELQGAQLKLQQLQSDLKQKKIDNKIFTQIIPKFQNEFISNIQEIYKSLIIQGKQCIDQNQNKDISDNYNDKIQRNQQNYIEIISLLEKQEQKIRQLNVDTKDQATQYQNTFIANHQLINLTLQQKKQQKNQEVQTDLNLSTQKKIINMTIEGKQIDFKILQLSQQKVQIQVQSFDVKLLKFSTTLKHSGITISADGKTAQSSGGWKLCLCDQPIPKNGTVVKDFKVKQIQQMMAGICLKDSYNKDYTDSSGKDKGCYFLYTYPGNSYVYSHHDPNKNNLKEGFLFYQNDIISMEVNAQSKQISWRNKAKNHVYSMDIQTTSDLYFCFQLGGQNEIKLV